MTKILVRDLHATEELDLVELCLKRTVANAQLVIDSPLSEDKKKADREREEKKAAELTLKYAQEALSKYSPNGDSPKITIGYLPPRKLTSLNSQRQVMFRHIKSVDDATIEQIDGFDELSREFVRWGVRGHSNLGVPFEADKAPCGPREYDVAAWETVDLYESAHCEGIPLLRPIYDAVVEFNQLDDAKKKPSSSSPGTTQSSSTVKSAD